VGRFSGSRSVNGELGLKVSDTLLPSAVRVGGMEKRELVHVLREYNIQFNQAAEALRTVGSRS
jgi:hypothetical protein